MSSKGDWVDELFDEDERTLFDTWRMAILKSRKMYVCDNFPEAAQYYIHQIQNDEYIPEQDFGKQYKRKLKEEEDD